MEALLSVRPSREALLYKSGCSASADGMLLTALVYISRDPELQTQSPELTFGYENIGVGIGFGKQYSSKPLDICAVSCNDLEIGYSR